MPLKITLDGKDVKPSHVLKKKAKAGFDPRMAFGVASYGTSKVTKPSTIGPKEQIIKLSNVPTRGQGTIGDTVGKKKRRSSFTRSTGNIAAGRTRSSSR